MTNSPEEYIEAIYRNFSWSTYYHLTPERQNILNWYPFNKDSSVLEIGCGMGAITNLLCERCKKVTAVELSKRRALATLCRCRECDNLEIIVGNLNDIKFEDKYDYITLIGVFEYQGSYTNDDNPYLAFLKKIKSLLKKGGKLLVAIENRYGLKYWCGASEDHTSIPFDGINGYIMTGKKVRTFSKKEIDSLIKKSGFNNTFFYYPMPDYKLPKVIYSDKHLPKSSKIENALPYYIPGNNTLLINESKVLKDIIDNEVYEFFANSFLVECSDSEIIGEREFAYIDNMRNEEYQMITYMQGDKVVKFPRVSRCGFGHVNNIVRNEEALLFKGINVCKSENKDGSLIYPFIKGKNVEDYIIDALISGNKEKAIHMLERIYDEILNSSDAISKENNMMIALGCADQNNTDKYGVVLKNAYIDMICKNAFLVEEELVWIDQEWMLEGVPAKFVMFRCLYDLYTTNPDIEKYLPVYEICKRFDLVECNDDFTELNDKFNDIVVNKFFKAEVEALPTVDERKIYNNIADIYNKL